MEFKDIVMQRYATKKFDGRKVPGAKMKELFELIRFAPSALNVQPWKIKVITDQKMKEQLRPATYDQNQVTTCSHLLVFCANTDFEGLLGRLEKLMRQAKVPGDDVKVVMEMARGYFLTPPPEVRLAMAQHHVYLAMGNAVNGAKSLGLDSCPMGGFDPVEYARILGLPAHLVPTMLCPVGYAADKPWPKIRFPVSEIFF
ncbi:MAG TPA: NAD(P)H-dependent oxidoreductase [Methanomicrobiales archaeon]|jgi:nitroreductase|nr:NAD(P)H-dependent oxidoreductase [Methanomicrobiales archaeon]